MKTLTEDYVQLRQVKKLLGDRGGIPVSDIRKSSLGQLAIDNKYLNDFDNDGVITENDYRIGWNWVLQGKPGSLSDYNKSRGVGPRATQLPYQYYQRSGSYLPASVSTESEDAEIDPLEQTSDFNGDGEVDELDAAVLACHIYQGRHNKVEKYNEWKMTYPHIKRLPNWVTGNFTCDGEDLDCDDDYDGDGRITEDDASMLYAYTSLIPKSTKEGYNDSSPIGFPWPMINEPQKCADFNESGGVSPEDALIYAGFSKLPWWSYEPFEKNWETGQVTGESYQEFFKRMVDSGYDFNMKHPPTYPNPRKLRDFDGDGVETIQDANLYYAWTSLVDTRRSARRGSGMTELEWFNANSPAGMGANPPQPPTPTPTLPGFVEVSDTLTEDVSAGVSQVNVTNVEQFTINTPIVFGRGTASEEYNTIVGFYPLILSKPLVYSHTLGDSAITMPESTLTANISLSSSDGQKNIVKTSEEDDKRIYSDFGNMRAYYITTDEDMGSSCDVGFTYADDQTTQTLSLPFVYQLGNLYYYTCTWRFIDKISFDLIKSDTTLQAALKSPSLASLRYASSSHEDGGVVEMKHRPSIRYHDFVGDGKLTSVDALVYYLLLVDGQWQEDGLDTTKRSWFENQNYLNLDYGWISHRNADVNEKRKVNDLLYILSVTTLPPSVYVPIGLARLSVSLLTKIDWRDFLIFIKWLMLGKPRSEVVYNELRGESPEACRMPFEAYEEIGTSELDGAALVGLENL